MDIFCRRVLEDDDDEDARERVERGARASGEAKEPDMFELRSSVIMRSRYNSKKPDEITDNNDMKVDPPLRFRAHTLLQIA